MTRDERCYRVCFVLNEAVGFLSCITKIIVLYALCASGNSHTVTQGELHCDMICSHTFSLEYVVRIKNEEYQSGCGIFQYLQGCVYEYICCVFRLVAIQMLSIRVEFHCL